MSIDIDYIKNCFPGEKIAQKLAAAFAGRGALMIKNTPEMQYALTHVLGSVGDAGRVIMMFNGDQIHFGETETAANIKRMLLSRKCYSPSLIADALGVTVQYVNKIKSEMIKKGEYVNPAK